MTFFLEKKIINILKENKYKEIYTRTFLCFFCIFILFFYLFISQLFFFIYDEYLKKKLIN